MPTHRIRALTVTLGFGLVILGGAKLQGMDGALEPLVRLGLPEAFFPWIGWGEVMIGLALSRHRLHPWAGSALALWMLGAVGVHLWAGDPLGALLPGALGIVGALAAKGAPRVAWPWLAPLAGIPDTGLSGVVFVARHVATAFLVRWAVGGMLFWAALPLLALSHAAREGRTALVDRLHLILLYLLFYGFGAGGIWNFTGHVFMSDTVAASVGWAAGSGFQQELGFYALGTGVVALLTPWIRDRFWIAAAVAPSIFVYGAAFTHVEDYLRTGNDAPMNWSLAAVGANVVIPTIVLLLTWAYARAGGFSGGGLAEALPESGRGGTMR